MKISYNWLKDYIDFDLSPDQVSEILTAVGLEVEGIETVEQIPGGLAGVVVAEVLECEMHPDSDHLHVTKVNVGSGEPVQIVCGAPNVAKGQKVLLATIGTKLGSGDEEFKIKKSKIRGVESFGMICAEDELGIGTSHDGIMVLEPEAVPGTPAKDYLKLESDTTFEIGLTPNRIDGASHFGVARDLAAYLKLNGLGGTLKFPSVEAFKENDEKGFDIKVEDPAGSPRYTGITLKNIQVGPSPEWLSRRLNSIGVRSINNVVDVTNFVLHEVGLPLHAFDADKVAGNEIIVKRAVEGTEFVTLDGVTRKLSAEDLMICDANEPMCMAGIFGGEKSGVTESTKSIFLECAYFNPVSVRKSSKRHTLKTDASFRYERGVDIEVLPYALRRAVLLLQEVAGAEVCGHIMENYPVPYERKQVELDFNRMREFIGKDIPSEKFREILPLLDIKILSDNGEQVTVEIPAYRVDVYRECDVVEDILRIYGFNNIELPRHLHTCIAVQAKPDPEMMKQLACNLLADNGFNEIMNNSLTKAAYYDNMKTYPKEDLVMILNPLSSDLNAMRQTLIFSGLEVISHNSNRQYSDLRLFELGNVYSLPAGADKNLQVSYKQSTHLSIFITGTMPHSWRGNGVKSDFYVLKGYVEMLIRRFGLNITNLQTEPAPADLFSEGISYTMGKDNVLMSMGIISQARRKQFGIKQEVYAAEINWDMLYKMAKKTKVQFKELPKFPEVKRDLALLLDENITYADIRKVALASEKKLLKSVDLFDVYRGDKLPAGKKQYAVSFVLQDLEKTLTDKAVEAVMEKILKNLTEKCGAALR